jgi:pyruvate-formate lyase
MTGMTLYKPEKVLEKFGVVAMDSKVHRLSSSTRQLAARYLSGEFGRSMKKASFSLDPKEIEGVTASRHSALAVKAVAEQAPLRIVEEELLAGAATLLEGPSHHIPLTSFWSTSHTTIGFEQVLQCGYRGLRCRIKERLDRGDLDEKGRDLLQAMQVCLEAAGIWHQRYVQEIEKRIAHSAGDQREPLQKILSSVIDVPENPPVNFRQAVQSLWMMWEFQRLCGNWSGLGRIDKILGPWLEKDLAEGRITLEDARELLAHFWIKGCEWIGAYWDLPLTSGDAQYYQNIILSGIDSEGRDVTNAVTYLVLDIAEELHISDFPIAVRVNKNTPERLFRRIAEVQRLGGGIVSIYNEELVIKALTRFGYPLPEAREFTNDGCWEVLIPGKTAFNYWPFDTLQLLQETLGLGSENQPLPFFNTFDDLYQAFRQGLAKTLEEIHRQMDVNYIDGLPSPLLSLFVDDCIERGRGYHDRGAKYSVMAPHAGGLPDTINSLYVLKKFIFDEKVMTLPEFVNILRNNWEGREELRGQIRQRYELYGNDNPEANAMAVRVFDDYVELAGRIRERNGVLRPPGISTFGREIGWRNQRAATAFGRLKGEILATNLSPTPGTDYHGPTAVIKSYCSMDFEKLPNGVPLELKILPLTLKGEAGLNALVGMMKTFMELGGWYLQVDVVDSEVLRDAQKHPEKYPNLSVRISGWSARFTTMNKEWQDMIIQRTQQELVSP